MKRLGVPASVRRSFLLPAGSSARAAAVLALIGALVSGCGQQPTPSGPPASAEESITTITIPGAVQDEALMERAEAVISERLRTLGIGTFSAAVGDRLTFTIAIPASVASGDVEAVLNARGDVQWLAWSAAPWASEGDPVREGVAPLFGRADIASTSVQSGIHGSPGGILVRLKPAASEALNTYSSLHVGQPALPLAMDGTILLSPIIQGPMASGEIVISFAEDAPISPEALAAILASGPLPAASTDN